MKTNQIFSANRGDCCYTIFQTVMKIPPIAMVVIMLIGLANIAVAADVPQATSLSGKVASRHEWGPPGFGETREHDKRLTIFLLELDPAKSAIDLSLPETTRKPGKYSKCNSDATAQSFLNAKSSWRSRLATRSRYPANSITPFTPLIFFRWS